MPELSDSLPPLYREAAFATPQILDGKRLAIQQDYDFAAGMIAVPLLDEEILAASAHYPIAFTVGDEPHLVAILGLKAGENLFVERGKWAEGAYVPAYIRRYPLIGIKVDGGGFALGVDPSSKRLGPDGVELFREGEATQEASALLDFCIRYHLAFERTRAYSAHLRDHGLISPHAAEVRLPSGAIRLDGFGMINRSGFDALDDTGFLEMRRLGYLPLVFGQLASAGRLAGLIQKAGARGGSAAAATVKRSKGRRKPS